MSDAPLSSIDRDSRFIASVVDRPIVVRSTIAVWSDSPFTGIAEGEVQFTNGIRHRLREELDFAAALITSYGYEVYRAGTRLYWYDDFPHPDDPTLASTFPHHKHVPPDIKRNRVPAPGIRFDRPNLEHLVLEISDLG